MHAANEIHDLNGLEAILDYRFQNRDLLERALTHRSALTAIDDNVLHSYQRLEFVGDRVLAVVISDMLYVNFPKADEGELARRLTALVRKETCADVARDWNIPNYIIVSEVERRLGGHKRDAVLGDVCEAILAAVYFDGGMEAAATLIKCHWHRRMSDASRPLRDPKTALQEWAHGKRKPVPIYHEVSRSGPDHALTFVMEVRVDGYDMVRATGSSKREAQQKAACAFLLRKGIWKSDFDNR